jgi:hypothetical protein
MIHGNVGKGDQRRRSLRLPEPDLRNDPGQPGYRQVQQYGRQRAPYSWGPRLSSTADENHGPLCCMLPLPGTQRDAGHHMRRDDGRR